MRAATRVWRVRVPRTPARVVACVPGLAEDMASTKALGVTN
jgi:hypothetical protein